MADDNLACDGCDETTALSPQNRFKFLCSHGGKILPRPVDGRLKYVGGETRVVVISRDTTYAELMRKLSNFANGDMILKYQIEPQDLDALITVRTDEDLCHMLETYDPQGVEPMQKLRAYLFPSKPIVIENQGFSLEAQTLEQRYIDAVNGIIRGDRARCTPFNRKPPVFSISACSSPKSAFHNSPDSPFRRDQTHGRLSMHRVQSSPALSSLSDTNTANCVQLSPPGFRCHHRCHNSQKQHQYHAHQAHKAPDSHMDFGHERPMSAIPMGQGVSRRKIGYELSPCSTSSPWKCYGQNHLSRHGNAYGYGRLDRGDSLPQTPVKGHW